VIKSFWKGSEAKVSKKTNEIIELTLIPTKDENIAKVVTVISAKDYLIESLAYEDHQGNKITLTFKYSDIGKPVDKVIFKKHWNDEYTIIN
jgi:trans-2-enoyl-CoA reductase